MKKSEILQYITIFGAIIYIISLAGPFSYYGSNLVSIYKIPTLILIIVGSTLIGYGISHVLQSFHFVFPTYLGVILIFFIVKLIIDIWISSILVNSIFSAIGWIVWSGKIIFTYIIIYDIIWCLFGISFVLYSILELNYNTLKINFKYMKVDIYEK